MSGAIAANPYLTELFTQSGGSASLLQILSGGGTVQTDPLAAMQQAERDQTKEVAATEAQPATQRDIAAFKAAIGKAKTPADLFNDPSFVKVLLTANGLGDELDSTALVKKALLSDASDSKSLVNQLTDTRWKSVNQLYDFANKGLANIASPAVQQTLADGYAEVQWRQGLDKTTPGLSDALSFRTQAASVTSVDQILGDSLLRRVVTTALGIPQEIAIQPLTTQENVISTHLDVSRLKDPKFVDALSQRYLLAVRDADASSSGSASSLLA